MITTFSWLSALQAVYCVTLASAARFDAFGGSFDPSRVASEISLAIRRRITENVI